VPASRSRDPFLASIKVVLDVSRRKRFRVALIGGFALAFHGAPRATGDVDFLVAAEGSDGLPDTLTAAGARCLHRSADAANYARGTARFGSIDFIYARCTRARAMLKRARHRPLHARLRVDDLRGPFPPLTATPAHTDPARAGDVPRPVAITNTMSAIPAIAAAHTNIGR
jgi:hypothetical protein